MTADHSLAAHETAHPCPVHSGLDRMTLRELIAQRVKAQGLTGPDISKATNGEVHKVLVHQVISGKVNVPTGRHIRALAAALDLPMTRMGDAVLRSLGVYLEDDPGCECSRLPGGMQVVALALDGRRLSPAQVARLERVAIEMLESEESTGDAPLDTEDDSSHPHQG